MRCSHCAVGYTLQTKDPDPLPMDIIYRRLDEIPNLRTLSITGGEPMFSKSLLKCSETTIKICTSTWDICTNEL